LTLIQSLILGVVQGLTEFLPVSSSGHLVLVANILSVEPDIPFDILLHFATLTAVVVFFYKDIFRIIKAFIYDRSMENPDYKIGLLLIAASIPTAIIGFALKDIFEAMFSSLFYVGCFLLLTGALITIAEKFSKPNKNIERTSFIDALIVGLAQGCAIAPGLSRSGTTVSSSLLLGFDRELAARFSFLLSIPAILGASIFKAKYIMHDLSLITIIGALAAAITGYLAIYLFMKLIRRQSIMPFAFYCLFVGLLSIFLSLQGI
jgi:undecaprenyl-diphosphatase